MLTKSAAAELLQMIQNVKHYLASPCCTYTRNRDSGLPTLQAEMEENRAFLQKIFVNYCLIGLRIL